MELRCRMNAEAGVFSIILQPGVMLDFQKLGITERMPGLAPCRVAIREELRFLDYYVSGCRPLAERLKEPMSKEVFLNLGRQLAASGAALESAGISQELSVEPETVFLSEKGALFCYIPIEGYRGGSFRRLFQQILARSSFREGEDAFVQALHQYLQNHAALSLRDIQSFLQTLKGGAAKGYYVPQAAPPGQKPVKGGTVLISDAVQLRNQAEAAVAQAKMEETRQAEEARRTEEACQAEEARRAEEVRQAEEARRTAQKAVLVYSQTGERISLEQPILRIGKKRDNVDYCIAGNPAVSRHHADILRKEDDYFLIDRNSLNKTYVNGREIEPQKEVQLSPQDRISFANEIFVFLREAPPEQK